MARTRKKKEAKTERHVVVCTFVIETPEETDITNGNGDGVIPNLVNEVDERIAGLVQRNADGSLMYGIIDVTMFTERGFMFEARKHGFPRHFPDVWVNGQPQEMTIKEIRPATRRTKIKRKVQPKTTQETTR
jgi:hypothetical protein